MVTARYVPDIGHIVWLQFSPQAGHEQWGQRPALVLSPSVYNQRTGLGVFCPITSRTKGYPFEVQIPDSYSVNGVILADQVKSLDWRARQAQFAEQVSPRVIAEVNAKLSVLLARNNPNESTDTLEQFEELFAAAESFLDSFELVFDHDWDMTESCLENSEHYISTAGTFVRPMVHDESNNWGNRGALLADYRKLKDCMSAVKRSINFS